MRHDRRAIKTLVLAAKAGRQAALDRFARLPQDRVFRFAIAQLQDQQLAADATQETFVRMLRQLDRWPARVDPMAWLLGIARNVTREFRRRRQRNAAPPAPRSNGPINTALQRKEHRQLFSAINQLPAKQREVISLRVFEQLNVEQTSAAMHCATGTVKALLFKAIGNLRKPLKVNDED